MSNGISTRIPGPGETGVRMSACAARTLRENVAWNFAGNAVYSACQWGMLIILAKLGTTEMLGMFSLALAVTAPVTMFFNLQLSAIQATDASTKFKFGHYFALRLLTCLAAGATIAAITFGSYSDSATQAVILIVGLMKIVESISDILYGAMQQRERMDLIAYGNILKGPCSLLTLTIAVVLTHELYFAVIAMLAVWSGTLLFVDFKNAAAVLRSGQSLGVPYLQPEFQWKKLGALAMQSLPLGGVMMLISLNYNIPRYLIAEHFGARELGIFSALAYILVATSMVVNTLGQAASPRLAHYIAAGDRSRSMLLVFQLILAAALIGAAGVFVAQFAGKDILTLIYRHEFAQQIDLFVWLMIAAGISHVASILGYAMTAARQFAIQLPLFAAVCIASTIACVALIPEHGLTGLAMGMAVGFIVQLICSAVVVIRTFKNIKPVNS